MSVYDHRAIETKWQARWKEQHAFRISSVSDKPKYYVLDMFPYPSGHGLHVGHLKGYIASDVVARYKRMRGFNVLHPMGWDSFGLPTERQAEKDGLGPQIVTERNIATFKSQLNLVGLGYDWSRELATSNVDYYRWTQWIFTLLYDRGLAVQTDVSVNWCPALGTVVANEEVHDGTYIETGDPIERRRMRQWQLRITAYADRLLDDLTLVDWPEEVKELQRHWIGRSQGAVISFQMADHHGVIEVFSTRPDTLFGCAYLVLAPGHNGISQLTDSSQLEAINTYTKVCEQRTDRERLTATASTGVFTGGYVLHPFTRQRIPVWVADYVQLSYGTGAVFGCPAHDSRDYAFATLYDLPIIDVVQAPNDEPLPYEGPGLLKQSQFLDGLTSEVAKAAMIGALQRAGLGRGEVKYRLRDWLFSRQRYWGEPIPVLHREDGAIEVDRRLPITLPSADALVPPSESEGPAAPLARAIGWLETNAPSDDAPAMRETNVMPQWAGSCWYYLRFIDPMNQDQPFDSELERKWMPVDLYIGGIEHATLHLLYARFWHKVLFDAGYVSTPEPFKRLFNQGKVQARSFRDQQGKYYYPSEVEERDGGWYTKSGVGPLNTRVEKMSKSRYNVATPDEVVESHGADSLRLYEMFMGPLEQSNLWNTDGLSGTSRFLDRVWRLAEASLADPLDSDSYQVLAALHQTILNVQEDIERLSLNTSVSRMMIFCNEASQQGRLTLDTMSKFLRVLAPFAPHVCEDLWQRLGGAGFILDAPWPEYNSELATEEMVTIAIQVNGKRRSEISIARGSNERDVVRAALNNSDVAKIVPSAQPARVIYRENKILNLVYA